MARELRRRSSRPNYAALLHYEDEDGAGPSNARYMEEDEVGSGSDFAPDDAGDQPIEVSEDDELDDSEEEIEAAEKDERMSLIHPSDEETPVVVTQAAQRTSKKVSEKKVSLAPGISARQQSVVIPSTHHRHRAVSLHTLAKNALVERLSQSPLPFKAPTLVPTNNFACHEVSRRVPWSWSYNVGPGPLWELMEDRGWHSESALNTEPRESARRPRTYQTVQAQTNFSILSAEEAGVYLPKGRITCLLGPFGHQERVVVNAFDAIIMNKFFPEDISHVFSAGAPVWAIDWCPVASDDREAIQYKQYLAIGALSSYDYEHRIGAREASSACIQIWSINPSMPATHDDDATNSHSAGRDPGCMRCEMVLCIDTGPACELKWCPLPSNDPLQPVARSQFTRRKLGLLAGTFCDGTACIYAVPYPADINVDSTATTKGPNPVFVKLSEPLVRINHPETACWCLDWANSEVLAVGCTNGTIAVYNVSNILNTGEIIPTHFFNAHQSAIRSLSWCRAPTFSADGEVTTDSPTTIISAGYDGVLHAIDIRAPCGNDISRTRDAINTVYFSSYNGGPITIDQGLVKVISVAPILLNKGHTILDADGPVWHIGASDYHPQAACAMAEGSLITTNTFRHTRRGGSVPFLEHQVYQMDYNEKTKEYRMLDHLKPREVSRTAGAGKAPPKSTGAWHPEVGIHRAVWNNGNGLAGAPWLASATASGLCRVDWLRGKWFGDRIPYDGVDGIRLERQTSGENEEDSD